MPNTTHRMTIVRMMLKPRHGEQAQPLEERAAHDAGRDHDRSESPRRFSSWRR